MIKTPQLSGFLNYIHNPMGGTKRLYEQLDSLPSSNVSRKEYNELKKRVIELESFVKRLSMADVSL